MSKLTIIPIFAVVICGCNQSEKPVEIDHSQFSPVIGAFGWNLDDKLPATELVTTDNDDFYLSYDFTPNTPSPPFNVFWLRITSDRTIYEIGAIGSVDSDELEIKTNAIIQALTEKYGTPGHNPVHGPLGDNYFFGWLGTDHRSAELTIQPNKDGSASLELTYQDEDLRVKAGEEDYQRKTNAENSLKENFKNQGL